MADSLFSFTSRARPVVEIGIGNSQVPTGAALWDVALWDAPESQWAGDEPLWRDVSCFAQYADGRLGRGRVTDAFPVGTLDIAFDNQSGWADPVMVDVDGVLSVRPGRAIRVGVAHVEFGVRWLFRGFIDGVEPLFDPEEPDSVMFRCIDALGEVGRAKLSATVASGADEAAASRVTRILDAVPWLESKRQIDPVPTAFVAAVLEGQVVDLLRRCADSVGGACFGDGNGDVVFRGRDWLYHTTDTPLDGTIGNSSTTVTSTGFVSLPAAAGNALAATNAGALATPQVTVMVRARGNPPSFPFGYLSPSGWHFSASATGQITMGWRDAGSGFHVVRSEPIAGFPVDPNGWMWVAVELDVTGGTARFFVSVDAETWIPAGVRTFTATTMLAPAPTEAIWLGVVATPTDFARVIVRDGVDGQLSGGAVVFDFDATADIVDPNAGSITTTSGHTLAVFRDGDPHTTLTESVSMNVPDVCVSGWRLPFVRSDITTRVILDRMMPPGTLDPPPPRVYNDTIGQRQYGVEPVEVLDLWTRDNLDLDQIGQRTLAQRNAVTLPLVQSVTVDAAASGDAGVDLLTLVDIWRPSRYRCRHITDRGTVFDDTYFATGVSFHIEQDSWTAEISLDKSELFEIPPTAAEWDVSRWDRAVWT